MKIKIAERLHPFSHLPGAFCLVPCSTIRLQIFPTLIRIHNYDDNSVPTHIGEIALHLTGPVKEFTIQQDLEKGGIKVWGRSPEGYFCYKIFVAIDGAMHLKFEKALKCTPTIPFKILDDEYLFSFPFDRYFTSLIERLSLGNHKAQDWEMVKRRQNMAEIFPHWFRLAAMTPQPHVDFQSNALEKCLQAIEMKKRETLLGDFESLFAAGFEGILAPRAFDTDHQGLELLFPSHSNITPLVLLTEGAKLIRSLFLQQEHETLALLPAPPVEFHAGRATRWNCGDIGLIDFEWSKKSLRRLILQATATKTIRLSVQNHLKKMRLRSTLAEKGHIISCDTPIDIQKDLLYLFDNFQH